MDSTNHLTTDAAHFAPPHRHGHAVHSAPSTGATGGIVAGPWELTQLLGEGQWACVYAGRPAGSPHDWPSDYAIKMAKWEGEEGRQSQRLLAREVAILREVAHPHLVAVLSAHLDITPPLMVMPLMRGATLDVVLAESGRLPTPHALWIVRQIAEAFCVLHEAGWMHSDVKPGNIHVTPAGHATLIDLGFALRLDSPECRAGGALRGTLAYTSPEMISAAVPVDGHGDVYGLGATLYELLTGKPPFTDPDMGRLMLAHLQRPAPNPRNVLPGLHHGVSQLLLDMLAKEPLRRPDRQELVDRLVDLEIATLEERAA